MHIETKYINHINVQYDWKSHAINSVSRYHNIIRLHTTDNVGKRMELWFDSNEQAERFLEMLGELKGNRVVDTVCEAA